MDDLIGNFFADLRREPEQCSLVLGPHSMRAPEFYNLLKASSTFGSCCLIATSPLPYPLFISFMYLNNPSPLVHSIYVSE